MPALKRTIAQAESRNTISRRAREELKKAINWELARFKERAKKQIGKALSHDGTSEEKVDTLLADLEAVVSSKDWRPLVERSADGLRQVAKHIREAVKLALRVAEHCPSYSTIPSIVWESTGEAKAEQERIAALPDGEKLFGQGGAIESFVARQRRTVVHFGHSATDFLKTSLAYAEAFEREAARLVTILKARDKRYDRLGPILTLIRDMNAFTGEPRDDVVARLLMDAYRARGIEKQFSKNSICKRRKRYLSL